MIYDCVIVTKGRIPVRQGTKEAGNQLWIREPWSESDDGCAEIINGTVLVLRWLSRENIKLFVYGRDHKVQWVGTKRVVFLEEGKQAEHTLLSSYELFWAAGAVLDPLTRRPYTNAKGETSLRGVYYESDLTAMQIQQELHRAG